MMAGLISHASGAVDRIAAGGKYEAGRQIRLLVQGAAHRNPLFCGRQRGSEVPLLRRRVAVDADRGAVCAEGTAIEPIGAAVTVRERMRASRGLARKRSPRSQTIAQVERDDRALSGELERHHPIATRGLLRAVEEIIRLAFSPKLERGFRGSE